MHVPLIARVRGAACVLLLGAWALPSARATDAAGADARAREPDAAISAPRDADTGDGSRAADAQAASDALEAGVEAVGNPGPLLPPLPPVRPTPELSPVMEGAPPAEGSAAPLAPGERPLALVKVILGLAVLLSLAFVAGHPAVQRAEERLGISEVITAGFPFVLLGALARRPEIGIFTDDVLVELSPILRLGLGWVGFMVGFRFDVRSMDRLSPGGVIAAGLVTTTPFCAVLLATALAFLALSGAPETLTNPVFLRDAIVLGTAGATTARTALRLLRDETPGNDKSHLVARIFRIEEVAGVVGLAVVAAYFRPQVSSATWQLPGTAWLLLTLGLGMAMGILMFGLLRAASSSPELLVVTLGTIVFAAGFAGNVRLSPVVVCFVMGLLVTNAPGPYKAELGLTLRRLERPLYFLFLLIVGALWRFDEWRGWLLMAIFVAARLAGKWAGVSASRRRIDLGLTLGDRQALVLAPLGPLALAVVINAQLLYPGGSISLVLTAVVGGSAVMEILLQVVTRRRHRLDAGGGEAA
jgi:Kef-type K+ transport system membrane component KefB